MSKNQIIVTWHGHSCFSVSPDGFTIVLDPYGPDTVPGLPPLHLTGNQVLCSHDHRDHGCKGAVELSPASTKSPFDIMKIDTFHDDQNGALRGGNRIHILKAGKIRVAHMGDLGCMLKEEHLDLLKNLDAILLPVGGYYTIDAAQARELVRLISPRIVIPMHYRSDTFGYPVLQRLEKYTDLCKDVTVHDSNVMVIDESTKPQTAILRLN